MIAALINSKELSTALFSDEFHQQTQLIATLSGVSYHDEL